MNKICSDCGRENAREAFQCYACRSREFGRGPSAEYRAAQRANARAAEDKRHEEAIESLKQTPGTQHKPLLLAGGFTFAIIGLLILPSPVSGILFFLSAAFFGWFSVILRAAGWRASLERRRRP